MPEPRPPVDYVFGYGSLVALREPLMIAGISHPPVAGRLRGFSRRWAAAMNNWEAVSTPKHFVDREGGLRPRIRVAYLDIVADEGGTVNGLAIPVDAARLAELDAREVNYLRVDVSDAFDPAMPRRVFTYRATDAARDRCRDGAAEGNVFVSSDYLATVRRSFAGLGPESLAEFERTTEPLRFPERDLKRVWVTTP